jgi:hypothetical protein
MLLAFVICGVILHIKLFIFHFYSTFKKVTPSAMKKWSYIITWVVSLDRDNLEAFEEIDSVHSGQSNFEICA